MEGDLPEMARLSGKKTKGSAPALVNPTSGGQTLYFV